MSYADRLVEVQTAISKIVNGAQSYSIGDRSYTAANLADLHALEKYYEMKAARETRGGARVRGITKA